MNHSKKTFSLRHILLGSFFGGTFGGFSLMSENEKALGNNEKAQNYKNIGMISTLLIIPAILLIPAEITDNIPTMIIPISYSIGIYYYAKKEQEARLQRLLNEGGSVYAGKEVALPILKAFALTLAYSLIVAFFITIANPSAV